MDSYLFKKIKLFWESVCMKERERFKFYVI